jgi:hypothetical protein
LAGFRRDSFLPYFGKLSVNFAYFPHLQKRTVLRGFPKMGMENGARIGLIFTAYRYAKDEIQKRGIIQGIPEIIIPSDQEIMIIFAFSSAA